MGQHQLTHRNLSRPLSCATGESHTITLTLPDLKVRLAIDPEQAKLREERFVLKGSGPGPAFQQVKVLKDDAEPGDTYVELTFTRLRPGYSYSLSVEPGARGKRYSSFDPLTFSALIE